jgi:tRNA G18 (ribose-2'-O)-methylase SpoU
VRSVTDPSDPSLLAFQRLTDVAWRRSLEAEHGFFLAEGELVIARALAAGYRLHRLLTTAEQLRRLPPLPPDAEVLLVEAALAEQIAGYPVHRGALAAFARPAPVPLAELLAAAALLVVLEGLVDPTNVGAVIRSAAAFGADGLLLDPRCADPLYRRSVKVSTGAALQIPTVRAQRWPADLDAVRQAGFQTVALSPAGATTVAAAVAGAPRVALLLGTEGTGLSTHALRSADVTARIELPGAGVDSLNVAAAAAVALYEAARR